MNEYKNTKDFPCNCSHTSKYSTTPSFPSLRSRRFRLVSEQKNEQLTLQFCFGKREDPGDEFFSRNPIWRPVFGLAVACASEFVCLRTTTQDIGLLLQTYLRICGGIGYLAASTR